MKKALIFIGLFGLITHVLHATRPTVPSSKIIHSNINCNSVKLNWTLGDGKSRVIFARLISSSAYTPVDGLVYSANSSYSNSTEWPNTGGGNYAVYNADGTNFVTVTNLQPGNTYVFTIYEHDNADVNTEYLLSNAPKDTVTTYTINYNYVSTPIDTCQNTNEFRFVNMSTSTIPNLVYKWDFGNNETSNDSALNKHITGKGYVNVTLSAVTAITGCPTPLTKNVKIWPKKIGYIDYKLFKDTQCLDDNYYEIQSIGYLMPFPSGVTYRWWFGDNDSSTFPKMKHKYKTSGIFNVMLELNSTSFSKQTACKDTIFFKLTVLPSPVGNISVNDTVQCLKGNKFVFDNPDNTLIYYNWYFGNPNQDSSDQKSTSFSYNDIGTYKVIHVAFANTGCKGRDTIEVKVLPNINSDFNGLDTQYCQSNIADILIPNSPGGKYYGYPMGHDSLIPNVVGSYNLTYIFSDQYCSDTTTKPFRIEPTPDPYIGNDTAICSALSYVLKSNTVADEYIWNTQETTPSITVTQTGTYDVTARIGDCSASDTIFIDFSTPPKINLGSDTVICKGGGLWLNAFYPKSTYLWNTGSKDSSIYAFKPGKYSVTVTNPCGTVQDSVFLFFMSDYCDLFMANAFSPGNDLVNNIFMPRGRNITVLNFQIYNRWGEMVFETNENNVGWDGTYKGDLVQEGLYIWKLLYSTENGPYIKKSNAAGQVLLLR